MGSITNGAGMEILNLEVSPLGRFALKGLFLISPRLREHLLFGSSPACLALQKLLARALGGASMVDTRITEGPMNGSSFRCSTREKYFYLGSHVEDDVQRIIVEILRPGDVCYDVGGHAGYMSLLFSALVGLSGSVFTFEPSPLNFQRLRWTIEANSISNVHIANVGASDREGEATLVEDGSMSKVCEVFHNAPNISIIRTICLDDFAYRDGYPPPSFIKLDVEGHAGAALQGMQRIFERARPKLMCELHDDVEERRSVEFLSSYKYSLTSIDRPFGYPRRFMASPQ